MAAQRMVLGIFVNESAADAAAEALVAWVKAEDVVRRPVGVLVLGEDGQVKEHKLGAVRDGRKGAGIGLVLAIVAPPTLLAGALAGGLIGHFHHPGLGLSDADRERIAADLTGGKAAVGVLVDDDPEAHMLSEKLTQLGGMPEIHEISAEALDAVAAASPEADTPGA